MKQVVISCFNLAMLIACTTDSSPPPDTSGGVAVIAATGNPGSLFPPLTQSTTARQITELVYDYLTEVDVSLNTIEDESFARRLAKSWEWSNDSLSLAVQLDPDARWHDSRAVRSEDVVYSFSVYADSSRSAMSSQLARIDSVTATDSLTATFWFKERYPLQFYDATSQMLILPSHIYGKIPPDSLREAVANIKPIGTGRYRFGKENSGQSIELIADSANYRGRPGINRLIWRFFGSADEAARAVLAGEADIYDLMRPGDVRSATANQSLHTIMSPGSDYAFMTFNLKKSIFASRELRRALTMAVDRDAMVKNVFDSLAYPAIGPTVRYFLSTSSDLRQISYDPEAAKRLLDSLGWRADPETGIRRRGGRELRFNAILPSTSSNRQKMATLLQEQFRKVGVAFEPDPMEFGTFNSRLESRDFDAALASWHLGTSPASIRILWKSNAQQNLGSYASSQFDTYVDSAIATFDVAKSNELYSRAYQVAIDDAPAIWLYEPKLVLGIHKRLQTKPFRPDAWWWSLADWSIPAGSRIPRDRAR